MNRLYKEAKLTKPQKTIQILKKKKKKVIEGMSNYPEVLVEIILERTSHKIKI